MNRKYKILFFLILGAVGAAVLIYFSKMLDLNRFLDTLSKLDVYLLIFLGTAQIITQTLLAYKWHLLIKMTGCSIAFGRTFAIHLTGALVENTTPAAKIGSEPARVYLLHKESAALKDALAATFIDKCIGLLSFAALAFPAFLYVALKFTLPLSLAVSIFMPLSLLVFLSLTGIFLYTREGTLARILKSGLRLIERFKPVRLDAANVISDFRDSMRRIMQYKTILAQSLFISIVVWLLYPLKTYIIFHVLGSNVTFGLVVCVTFLSHLVGMVPAFPGGIGAYEGSAIALYSVLGIPLVEATVVVLIGRVFTFWFVSLLGALATIGLKTNLLRA